MASSNLELVSAIYGNWERGDWSSVEWADPEIVWVSADGPSPGTWTGLAGMESGWREWLSAWKEFRIQVDEIRELDDQRVLVLPRVSGQGKTSGVELGQMWTEGAALFEIREGKVTKFVFYWDRKRALTDLGLD